MPKSYSRDLREKIVLSYKQGEGSIRGIAKRFKVSISFVYRLLKREKQSGEIEAREHGGGHAASIREEGQAYLQELIKRQADLTLEEIRVEYNKHFTPVSRSTIDRTLRKLKISRKKKSVFDPRRDSPENQEKQRNYKNTLACFEAQDLIYLDEMGSARNITRSYARSEQGQRAACPNSSTAGIRISTIGALGVDGLITAFCFQGTLTAHLFGFFLENFLLPFLNPSKVVILDNAPSHHDEDVIEMIESTGARVLFLPPYSPHLNPIEFIWAKVKSFLRKVHMSTSEELFLFSALDKISTSDANNSFEHCLQLCSPLNR